MALGVGLMYGSSILIDEALAVCYAWKRLDGESHQSSADLCKQGAIAQYVHHGLETLTGLSPTAPHGAQTLP